MILKKPYAFLIKHFKLIHILLTIPLAYLFYRSVLIYTFLNTYVNSNFVTTDTNIAATYINYFMYIALLFSILAVLSVFFLMRQKKKNTTFYLCFMLFYILLFISISISYGLLDSIESVEIASQSSRMFRDLALLFVVPQGFFTIYTFLRGVGFNVKQFNFDEDARELDIEDVDSEEFEINFGRNNYKYERKFNRFKREFIYYVKENKITFTILMVVAAIAILTMVYLYFGVYHKTYRENKNVSHNGIKVSVVKSLLSNLDMGGRYIDDDHSYYMAISMKVNNTSSERQVIDIDNFKLNIGRNLYDVTLDRAAYFADLGLPYSKGTTINPSDEKLYVITYKVPTKEVGKDATLKILESLEFTIGSVTPTYKVINLSYDKIDENKVVKEVSYGKILELSDTNLGFTQIQAKDYKVANTFLYKYNSCDTLNNCNELKNMVVASSSKTLLIISGMFQIDQLSNYFLYKQSLNSFMNDFITVSYNIGDKTYKSNVKNVSPTSSGDIWIMEVKDGVKNADKIDLLVTVRGSVYKMNIK